MEKRRLTNSIVFGRSFGRFFFHPFFFQLFIGVYNIRNQDIRHVPGKCLPHHDAEKNDICGVCRKRICRNNPSLSLSLSESIYKVNGCSPLSFNATTGKSCVGLSVSKYPVAMSLSDKYLAFSTEFFMVLVNPARPSRRNI